MTRRRRASRQRWDSHRRDGDSPSLEYAVFASADHRKALRGERDRALIMLGFAGAFRRSELVAIRVGDLTFGPLG